MDDLVPLRRALLSVSNKEGLVEFGRALVGRGVELISTGGTARALREAGLPVRDVAEVTAWPEMMDGRVKTLHPAIHGALLAVRSEASHAEALARHGIDPIDLLVVDLYPFEAAVARAAGVAETIEEIDIGGPAMTRSAAKNHRFTTVLVEPAAYAELLAECARHGGATTFAFRRRMATQAFARTAAYDAAIAHWMRAGDDAAQAAADVLPRAIGHFRRREILRYGENPHQAAAIYVDPLAAPGNLVGTRVLGGKALSYNNYGDVDAAWALVREFDEPVCVVVKHANPCGVARGVDACEAYERAVACDPRSAFGGIVALNRPLDVRTAKAMAVAERFLEVIVAPGIADEAAAVFVARGAPKWGTSLRLLDAGTPGGAPPPLVMRTLDGGALVQTPDVGVMDPPGGTVVTTCRPDAADQADLEFACRVVKHVKSNAIVLVRDGQAIGVGAGQMSRVEATEIALVRARRWAAETGNAALSFVVAGDAFYPFNDAIELVIDAGATAILHPGGSRNDERARALCDERGVALVQSGLRHFRH